MNQKSRNKTCECRDFYNIHQTIAGNSEAMQKVFDLLERAVKIPRINISLHGEPGTGKKLLARTIHEKSSRSMHPFVPVNINAIPINEMEECFFGTEKGAFTGPGITKKGKFEEAGEGTLFIDEISDLEDKMQVSLLNTLHEGNVQRIGGLEKHPIRCRLITSTNGELFECVKNQNFREDLYYQLVGLPILLPPLRMRGDDIILLADLFLSKFCHANNLNTKQIAPSGKEKLMKHNYPGNIRELKAVIELAATLSTENMLHKDHIVFDHFGFRPVAIDRELTLKEHNEQIILHFLKKYKSVKEVANRLDIGKSTIYNLLKQHNQIKGDY